MSAFLRNEERFPKGVVLKPPALVRILAQHLGNGRVERHDARFVELRLADDEMRGQLIQPDVVILEPDCFPDPEARGCQRADYRRERVRAQ